MSGTRTMPGVIIAGVAHPAIIAGGMTTVMCHPPTHASATMHASTAQTVPTSPATGRITAHTETGSKRTAVTAMKITTTLKDLDETDVGRLYHRLTM